MQKNPYIPAPVKVEKIITEVETKDIKTFRLTFLNQEDKEAFAYLPGQFAELSIFGKGESPIGIASSPTDPDYIEFTVQKAGVVTTALHEFEEGALMGVRGPLGNSWPLDYLKGKDIVLVSGGFAFTTIRSLINYMLDERHRADFGKITVVYGARNPGLLLYREELALWQKRDDIDLHVTVDKGDEGWTGLEGFVPTVCQDVAPSSDNAVTLICGPPIMIRFTLPVFFDLGFSKDNIYTSLEMRMKCGIGKCGRCNVGSKYVCLDGPVFSLAELDKLTPEY
ncbi:MAG: FAD/NAD(P)-binding protein [Deltaproteobacteria bacterium]|nr:FAD/NAD(P)-binding protein [Deltaproteobacteria bacterium]